LVPIPVAGLLDTIPFLIRYQFPSDRAEQKSSWKLGQYISDSNKASFGWKTEGSDAKDIVRGYNCTSCYLFAVGINFVVEIIKDNKWILS
jgi:hypothetical protein